MYSDQEPAQPQFDDRKVQEEDSKKAHHRYEGESSDLEVRQHENVLLSATNKQQAPPSKQQQPINYEEVKRANPSQENSHQTPQPSRQPESKKASAYQSQSDTKSDKRKTSTSPTKQQVVKKQ
jgi:hypothetical protein